MVLVVIFHIKVSAGRRLFLSCLGYGVVRQNFREFRRVQCLGHSVGNIGVEDGYVGEHGEVTRPVGGGVNFFSEDGVGGVQHSRASGVGIQGVLVVSPGQSICKSLIRGWGAYRGRQTSP